MSFKAKRRVDLVSMSSCQLECYLYRGTALTNPQHNSFMSQLFKVYIVVLKEGFNIPSFQHGCKKCQFCHLQRSVNIIQISVL